MVPLSPHAAARRPGSGHGSALPRYSADLGSLLIRLARENPRWVSAHVQDALLKLGCAMVHYLSEGSIPT